MSFACFTGEINFMVFPAYYPSQTSSQCSSKEDSNHLHQTPPRYWANMQIPKLYPRSTPLSQNGEGIQMRVLVVLLNLRSLGLVISEVFCEGVMWSNCSWSPRNVPSGVIFGDTRLYYHLHLYFILRPGL